MSRCASRAHYGQECIVFHYNNVLKYPENWTCYTNKNNTLSRISSFLLGYPELLDKMIHSGYSNTYQNRSGHHHHHHSLCYFGYIASLQLLVCCRFPVQGLLVQVKHSLEPSSCARCESNHLGLNLLSLASSAIDKKTKSSGAVWIATTETRATSFWCFASTVLRRTISQCMPSTRRLDMTILKTEDQLIPCRCLRKTRWV
jgi:hypothetical protein